MNKFISALLFFLLMATLTGIAVDIGIIDLNKELTEKEKAQLISYDTAPEKDGTSEAINIIKNDLAERERTSIITSWNDLSMKCQSSYENMDLCISALRTVKFN